MNMQALYFNETGPIYEQKFIQANDFSKFVNAYVMRGNGHADKSQGGNVQFDWEAFRAAALSLPDLSVEDDLQVGVPSYATSVTANGGDVNDITIQAVLDALVDRFMSVFTHVHFMPAAPTMKLPVDTGYTVIEPRQSRTYFFDVLRRNLYYAFTRHFDRKDTIEFYVSPHVGVVTDACPRSAWEYRLLFVHADMQTRTVKGLVMTVTLEGNFEEIRKEKSCEAEDGEGDEENENGEACHVVSLESRGPFSGTLRAIQVVVQEGFRYH